MNHFFNDSFIFLRSVSSTINESMSKSNTILSTMTFALGMERILKGILYSINPLYVLKDPNFKNSISVLYRDKMLPDMKGNIEISSNPDADVITFNLSILRAKAVSPITNSQSALLHFLSSCRDIIAHHELSFLKFEKMKSLLLKDFYPLLLEYSKELNIPQSKIFASNNIRLATISSNHQESIEDKVQIKIEGHKERWAVLSKQPKYIEKQRKTTENILNTYGTSVSLTCPACENKAIVFLEADYDCDFHEGTSWVTGIFVTSLNCRFCKLQIDDYEEIDFLNLNEKLAIKDS